jgi:hypothetical protein
MAEYALSQAEEMLALITVGSTKAVPQKLYDRSYAMYVKVREALDCR